MLLHTHVCFTTTHSLLSCPYMHTYIHIYIHTYILWYGLAHDQTHLDIPKSPPNQLWREGDDTIWGRRQGIQNRN